MTLADLQKDMISSMKAGDKVRVDTIRFLVSAVRNQAIAKYGSTWETSLTEGDVVDVIKKQVKSHKESVLSFEKAGRGELAEKEKKELDILSAFLPKEISDEDLKVMLTEVVATADPSNFGLLMKSAMAKVGGLADGARVSSILKQLLGSKL
jgi:uncharacterized protein YqeY